MVALPSYFSIIVTLIALVMIIFCVIKGFKDGLVLSIFDLLALLVSLYVAYVCSGTLAVDLAIIPNSVTSGLTIVSNEIFNDMITMVINYFINWIIWFLIISIGLRIVLHFIRKLFKGINKIPVVKTINEYAGAIFGLVKAMIMIMIMAYVLTLPIFSNGVQIRQESLIEPLVELSRTTFTFVDESLDISETVNAITTGLTDLSTLSASQLDTLIRNITDMIN